LKEELENIILRGGEGLILRKPQSIYHIGRSNSLLKVKKQVDYEVKFLQKSSTGISFDCLLPNGLKEKIKCGMSDYNSPPLSGDILSVSHFGFTQNGNLKFPYFMRVRFDVSWKQITL
jgi:DNA ligase-1